MRHDLNPLGALTLIPFHAPVKKSLKGTDGHGTTNDELKEGR